MKGKLFLQLFSILLLTFLFTQCGRYGKDRILPLSDDDSDRPEWAGGSPELNPYIRGNEDSGTSRGGDYGDLYKLLRTEDGVPIMWQEPTTLEYYVQPVGADGTPLDLDAEGELIEPDKATEVEFGRLNIVRAPQSVLDQAFEEAMKVLETKGDIVVDDIKLDFCGRLTSYYTDNTDSDNPISVVKTIDSPRESMALYQYIMKSLFEPYVYEDGIVTAEVNRLAFLGQAPYNFDPLKIAASCFAAGSDKTGTVDIDEVVYINGFVECIGCNPILNEHDFNFSNEQNYYFNFSQPLLTHNQFQYNRDVYAHRYLKIITLNGDGTYTEEIESVKDVMEDRGLFSFAWGLVENMTKVEGFAAAIDDAVQVLDFVHGDSNVEFLPDYVPPTP